MHANRLACFTLLDSAWLLAALAFASLLFFKCPRDKNECTCHYAALYIYRFNPLTSVSQSSKFPLVATSSYPLRTLTEHFPTVYMFMLSHTSYYMSPVILAFYTWDSNSEFQRKRAGFTALKLALKEVFNHILLCMY